MAEAGSATTRRTKTGVNYASQWNHFVAWSRASGKCSLPASPEDVAGYLKDRSGTGASPSTLRVVVATIARNHRDAGFDVPPSSGRSHWTWTAIFPAHKPPCGRCGRMERAKVLPTIDSSAAAPTRTVVRDCPRCLRANHSAL